MRELGLLSPGILGAGDGSNDSFAEIRELASSCRFADCSHANEPGCAIRKAIENGDLNAESEFNQMSYVDKRKKDKAFGKMVKSVLKSKQK